MGIVKVGDWDLFQVDVLPDIHFGPVAQGKHPEVFAHVLLTVEDVPELWSLILGIPLSEIIPVGKETFLGPGFLLIAPPSSQGRIKFELLDGIQQCNGLQHVAAGIDPGLFHNLSRIDGVLDQSHNHASSGIFHQLVAKHQGFGKIVTGINMQAGEGDHLGPEGLTGQVIHYNGVLASGKQQCGFLKLSTHFTDHIDRFCFQFTQVGYGIITHKRLFFSGNFCECKDNKKKECP